MAHYDQKFQQKVQGGQMHVKFDGLLDKAHELWSEQGFDLKVEVVQIPDKSNGDRAVCLAHLKCPLGEFSDVGDADPSNVNTSIGKHLLRMASTRAKGRVLRDAQNHGEPTVEEMQSEPGSSQDGRGGRSEGRSTQRAPEEPQGGKTVASKQDRLKLAELIRDAGRDIDKFEERYGDIAEIEEGLCQRWIETLEKEIASNN